MIDWSNIQDIKRSLWPTFLYTKIIHTPDNDEGKLSKSGGRNCNFEATRLVLNFDFTFRDHKWRRHAGQWIIMVLVYIICWIGKLEANESGYRSKLRSKVTWEAICKDVLLNNLRREMAKAKLHKKSWPNVFQTSSAECTLQFAVFWACMHDRWYVPSVGWWGTCARGPKGRYEWLWMAQKLVRTNPFAFTFHQA